MNERIKQLALQSGLNITHAEKTFNGHILTNSVGLFAIGLIKECARVVDSTDSSHPYASFGDKLLAHFGIEE